MDHESEMIQQQMRQTRQALSEKLECLEDKVMGTVKSVTSTVDSVTAAARDTVSAAKETVQDTLQTARQTVHETVASAQETMHGAVDAVRHGLDVQHHVQEHPWTMMGAASDAVAQTLERTGRYLQEEGLKGIGEDAASLIRRYPIQSVLIGIGIGFLIARSTRS